MKNYQFVDAEDYQQLKENVEAYILLIQKEVEKEIPFQYLFAGSIVRNLVTVEYDNNIGYDLDMNLIVNGWDLDYSASEIYEILKAAFEKYAPQFDFQFTSDQNNILKILFKDNEKKLIHSCGFTIINDFASLKGKKIQEYIFFNKDFNLYGWKMQSAGFYSLPKKMQWLKENNCQDQVKQLYLKLKNNSRSKSSKKLYYQAIETVYHQNKK